MNKFSVLLVITFASLHVTLSETDDDTPAFIETARGIFDDSKPGTPDLGNLISNFIQSDSAKQMGSMLLNSGAMGMAGGGGGGEMSGQILQMIGNLMMENNKPKTKTRNKRNDDAPGLDLAAIGNVLSMVNSLSSGVNSGEARSNGDDENFDFGSLISFASNFISQNNGGHSGEGIDFMSYIPSIMEFVSSFYGPQAEHIAHQHAGHAWFLPPMFEKIHVFADQFINSNFGRDIVNRIGAEKFVKVFSDETGNFSVKKFTELLENHSFRRFWLKSVVGRLSEVIVYVAQPEIQKKYTTTAEFFLNSFLKGIGLPNSILYDRHRPKETLPPLIDFLIKKYLGIPFQSKQYVVPAVQYGEDLVRLAEKKGFLGRTVNSAELTHRLTETVNMEIIEPLTRVNRAVRYVKAHPKCAAYVLCIANQSGEEEHLSLPGVKKFLSQSASLMASWYISGYANVPTNKLNEIIMTGDCQSAYQPECQDFHIEELKVTTEYVHNEL